MASSRDQAGPAIRTFLVADIRGYTRFTTDHGDEAASRLAVAFAGVVAEGVEAGGGHLLELRGDEALAVFDSARAALRSAVELQAAFADETAMEPSMPLTVGMGLDIGEAVPVGDGYRGAVLNLASRLCAVAGPGEVLASADLVRLAGRVEGLDFAPQGPVSLKGLGDTVVPVRVRSVEEHPSGATSVLRTGGRPPPIPPELDPIVPLAGRRNDLHWLGWHWRRARHGRGRVVVISGQPGIGKTRLAAELATRAHADGAVVAYVPGAPDPEPERLRLAAAAGSPTLLIVDDLDAAPTGFVEVLTDLEVAIDGRPILLLVTHREHASPSVVAAAERLSPADRRRQLGPLEPEAVRAIAALYAGQRVDALPLDEILMESGGVPATVHRVASRWASRAATERLGSSADRTRSGRLGLRAAETDLIADVAALEVLRERTRLFVPDEAEETEAGSAMPAVCPYKGLAAYEATDTDHYFGRERLVAEIVARLVGASFLGLVGASGSGKSSAIQAGVLPALAGGVLPGSGGWTVVGLRPGEHPSAELTRALARALPGLELPDEPAAALDAALGALPPGGRLLLVIDQLEELFGSTRDEAERAGFIEIVTSGRPGLKVIASLRADHYGHCAAYPELARLVGTSQVLVGPLTRDELAAVIRRPAERVGLRVEPELVEALVTDVAEEPGALPLLSTALLELWLQRDGRRLTLASYLASGGVRGAVARLAEDVYGALDAAHQALARALFLRLAGPGEGEGVVRRRVALAELDLERDPAVAELVERLTSGRLLTSGDGYVEVAHEALLREWPRLVGWLEDDATGRRLRLHLITAARDWTEHGREPGDLYRGARLVGALDWAAEHGVELNVSERAFLDESRAAADRETERQRQTNRRLRALLAGAGALLVVAVAAGGIAALQGQRAEGEAARARAEELRAEEQARLAEQETARAQAARRLARSRELVASSIATLDDDPSLSKLLAVEAVEADEPSVETLRALHTAWAADPVVRRFTWTWPGSSEGIPLWTDLDPSGRAIVASAAYFTRNDHLEVIEVASGEVRWSADLDDDSVGLGPAFFTPDGRRVVAGVAWIPEAAQVEVPPPEALLGVHVWDAATGEELRRLPLGRCGGIVSAVSATGAVVRSLADDPIAAHSCSSGPDRAAPAFNAGKDWPYDVAIEWIDLATGSRTMLSTSAGISDQVTLSADGRSIAFEDLTGAPEEARTAVVDLSTGQRVLEFAVDDSGSDDPWSRALSPDGSLLAYGDRPILVLDVRGGLDPEGRPRVVSRFGGHAGEVGHVSFLPDGETVYSTGRDGTLRRWEATTGRQLAVIPAIRGSRPSVTADGVVLVGPTDEPTALLIEARVRGEVGAVDTCPTTHVYATSLSVVGSRAAFAQVCGSALGTPGSTTVVDLDTWSQRYERQSDDGQSLRISPDGSMFVRQEGPYPSQGPLAIHDLASGDLIRELASLCRWTFGGFGEPRPGDACRAFPEAPFPILLWQVEWSPDGSMIAAIDHGSFDGYVAVWDAASGALVDTWDPVETPGSGRYPEDVVFSPDSQELYVALSSEAGTGDVAVLSTSTWEVLREGRIDPAVDGRDRLGFIGFTADGKTLMAVGGHVADLDTALVWLDPDTLETRRFVNGLHDGSLKSMAMSPDGGRVATGSSDGLVRIWDVADGRQLDEISLGDTQVQGLAFVSAAHLAATPAEGDLFVFVVDPGELIDLVRGSLTRSFTEAECERFGFDPCPSLEDLLAG